MTRSDSTARYVLQKRILGGLAMLVLVAALVSDRLVNGFWKGHVLLTSLVSSLVVVALSVAIVNECWSGASGGGGACSRRTS